ncbi:MAG TPA: hypothetical protein VGX68_27695 [Thermoanaerobaculia bacterium]|jgi:hypothetical protein|nr:hypothetical protein [Thermoanaerobaculia bacterium]
MSEDRLLRDLGHLANEENKAVHSRLDERWDRMAAGTLTAEEEAELRALAETSPEAREAHEAFRPLGPDFQARIIDTIAAELTQPQAKPEPQQPPPRILPFRLTTVQITRWLTAAAAAAAVLFLLLRIPASMPILTAYNPPELSGGEKKFRGEEVPVYRPGSSLTVKVRPQKAVSGPLDVRAYFARGNEWVSWEPKKEVDGSVRLEGELSRAIHPGDWRLWIVVGRPGKIPHMTEIQERLREGQRKKKYWQAVSADLRVEEQVPP